ncbi:hypothetical protein Hanom_Chr07g00634691 [Helianthus anomalus]
MLEKPDPHRKTLNPKHLEHVMRQVFFGIPLGMRLVMKFFSGFGPILVICRN